MALFTLRRQAVKNPHRAREISRKQSFQYSLTKYLGKRISKYYYNEISHYNFSYFQEIHMNNTLCTSLNLLRSPLVPIGTPLTPPIEFSPSCNW